MASFLAFQAPVSAASTGSTSSTLVSTQIIYNDAASAFGQEVVWPITVQFRDTVVPATSDLYVQLADATVLTTQLQPVKNWASGCLSIGKLWLRIPANKINSGSNTLSVYSVTQARSTASAVSLTDIANALIETEMTNMTDYGGTPDGSGTFKSVVADYINAGEPATTILTQGEVCKVVRVRAVANDVVGGAAQAAGMFTTFDIVAAQSSGGAYDYCFFMPTIQMGDIANADPDIRKYDVDVRAGGSAIAGASVGWDAFSEQYLPYYSRSVLSRADGRAFSTNSAKYPPFRNILPFADWSSRTLRRLPPWRLTKLNSGTAIWSPTSFGEAQTIPTSGGDQGKVTLVNSVYWASVATGGNAVYFTATSYPTGVAANLIYYIGADTGSGKYYVYPTRLDAAAGTNKVIPSTGTISGGSGVVCYPAHSPMSMPTGALYWPGTGDRSELAIASAVAYAAVTLPSKGMMDTLRANALSLAYVPFNYRGTTTFRVPDIQTTSATYPGLGTGIGFQFSYDSRDRFGVVGATDHPSGNWYEDTTAGITVDSSHPPSCDYFYAWLHEPWPWYEDIAMQWMVGQITYLLDFDRSPTWNSVVTNNAVWASHSANWRGAAWLLRAVFAPIAIWPEAVTTGNNGERGMLDAISAAQSSVYTNMAVRAAALTPNALAMGILPVQQDYTVANWQMCGYFMPTATMLNSYSPGEMSSVLTAQKPYVLALGGNVGLTSGSMGPTRGASYYINGRTYAGANPDAGGYFMYEAPASQWTSFADGSAQSGGGFTISTGADTITLTLAADRPNDGPPGADGDQITFLQVTSTATVDSAIGFGNPKFVRDLSFASLTATFKVANTAGGSPLNLTSSANTDVKWAWKRASERSFGFCNSDLSNLVPLEDLEGAYWLSWALGGMNTELTTVNNALTNFTGIGTEPDFGADSRHLMDIAICQE